MSQTHEQFVVAATSNKSSAVSPATSAAGVTAKIAAVEGSTKDSGRVHIGGGMMRF